MREMSRMREMRETRTNWPLGIVVHSVFAIYNPSTNKQK
jgi:hypothetical protein